MNAPETYPELKERLADGEVDAFVGAGLSTGAGLPGWYDLVAELSQRIGYRLPPAEWTTGDALIDAAQAYVNRQGLQSLIAHLKDRLDTTGRQPSAAHRALARLPVSLVFTANFDDLLERAFREAGKRIEVVARDSTIPFMRRGPNIVNIVKLYGDLDQPDTIVLARQQYESYFVQRPQIVKLLEVELSRANTLYLGWSGSDPYFKLVFGELLARFGDVLRPGFAVMFGVSDSQRDELARKHIQVVELPADHPTAELAEWLANLGRAAPAQAAAKPVQTTPAVEPAQPERTPSSEAREFEPRAVMPLTAVAATLLPGTQQDEVPPVESGPGAMARPDLQLLIELSPDARTLSYTLNSPDGDYNFLPVGSVNLMASPRDLLQRSFERLSTWAVLNANTRTPQQTEQANRELSDLGANLYDELFPVEFKQEYQALRERHLGGNLLITTNDPWIPWEVVRPLQYDRRGAVIYNDPPLCESYRLARWVAGTTAPSKLALDRGVIIQPSANLAAARAERAYFEVLPDARPGFVVSAPLQTVADTLASFSAGQTQLYHFACHGNFDLTDPNDSKLKLADGFLTPSQITGDRRSGLLRARPVVFVNACQAGGRGFGMTRLGGWAERFIVAGASAFIGSLWEINDVLAARFAAEFYDRLFGHAGHAPMSLAEAFSAARLVLRDLDPANPTWLAYVLYGNPRARAEV